MLIGYTRVSKADGSQTTDLQRDALVAGGVAPERVKLRKPESTIGSGNPEEGRRVEVRVQ